MKERALSIPDQEPVNKPDEISHSDIELSHHYREMDNLANELMIANRKLALQNSRNEKRAAELVVLIKELALQHTEKAKLSQSLKAANRSLKKKIIEIEQQAVELLKAKDHAEESDRLKSAFLANMSHEIRTPMNAILGFASLLKHLSFNDETRNEYISIIEKSGDRMLNVINDITIFSKVEAGKMNVNISPMKVNEQLKFICDLFRPEAMKKGLQLVIKRPSPARESIIKTDSEKFYGILSNLVKNAIKFTHTGAIVIGYRKDGKHLVFFVEDTGEGIPLDKREIIFERFRQGSELHTRNYEGTGLGLAISKAYVEMLGGKIWVESEYRKGSVFYFTIPHHIGEKIKSSVKKIIEDDKKIVRGKKLKILIAEDDEASEMLIRIAVKIYGKEVLTARTGVEAVEICHNYPGIDLVLMDIKMPVMDGYEATKRIRQFNKDVVIIAQTAFGFPGDREKAIEAGCNDFLQKPFNNATLNLLVQSIINNAKN